MKIIQIVSGILSLIFGIFAFVFIVILPLIGIHFDYNIYGASMEPTLANDVDIRLSPKWAPYENLKVGDIILFRQRDYLDSNMPPGVVYAPEWNKEHTKIHLISQTELEEEPPKYIRVRHRIIAINEKGLVTKGDNNRFQDFLPVKSEEYQGKIIWHMNHINWLFRAMYNYGLWTVCTVLYFVMSFFLWNIKASNISSNDLQYDSVSPDSKKIAGSE